MKYNFLGKIQIYFVSIQLCDFNVPAALEQKVIFIRASLRDQGASALVGIPVTEKSVAEVVYILLGRYERNITHVTDSRQCQPC